MQTTSEVLSINGRGLTMDLVGVMKMSVLARWSAFTRLCCCCVVWGACLLSTHGMANAQSGTMEPPAEADEHDIIVQFVDNWPDVAGGHAVADLAIADGFYPLYNINAEFWAENPPTNIDEQLTQLQSWISIIEYKGSPIAGVETHIDEQSIVTAGRSFDIDEADRILNYLEGDRFIVFSPQSHYFILRADNLIPVNGTAHMMFPGGISVNDYRSYVRDYIAGVVVPPATPVYLSDDPSNGGAPGRVASSTDRIAGLALGVFVALAIGAAMVFRQRIRTSS